MRTLSLAVALAAGLASIAHAQPANDSCFAPEPIFGFGSIFFSTVDAETDGEPSPSCLFFGQEQVYRDIWFRWSPDESGLVRIGLCDSDFDTKIAIYSGYPKGGCPDPSAVIACNDDSCGLRSVVTFFAEAGVVYAIRLGSYGTPASGGSTGSGTMVIESGYLADVVDPASGQRYVLVPATTWTGAEALAQSIGGHLASIGSFEENDFILKNFGFFDGQDRRLWIGFNDADVEGDWRWSDGSKVTFTNWNGGEPNNANGVEHYAEMLGSNGAWNDLNDAGAGYAHLAVVELGEGGGGGPGGCISDLDGDGFTSGIDLGIVLAEWGGPGKADLDNDGIVGGVDLGIVLAGWGPCP
jgi:hypothetical protein